MMGHYLYKEIEEPVEEPVVPPKTGPEYQVSPANLKKIAPEHFGGGVGLSDD